MVHQMGLFGEYFNSIIEGKKTVEVRLNDEKRRKIKVGDIIEFIKVPEQNITLKVQVTNVRTYKTFKEMYEDIAFKEFDCEGWTMKEMIEGTYEIYTREQEKHWGVLAISIKPVFDVRKLKDNEEPPLELLLLADPSKSIIKEYLENGKCFVVEVNYRVIGVYVLVPIRPDTVELVNIAVSEDYQGRGIGKRLVMDAIQRAKMSGYKTIDVGTGNSSINQLSFYQKCGFRIVGIERDFFINNYPETIFENGIQCRDMVRLSMEL